MGIRDRRRRRCRLGETGHCNRFGRALGDEIRICLATARRPRVLDHAAARFSGRLPLSPNRHDGPRVEFRPRHSPNNHAAWQQEQPIGDARFAVLLPGATGTAATTTSAPTAAATAAATPAAAATTPAPATAATAAGCEDLHRLLRLRSVELDG